MTDNNLEMLAYIIIALGQIAWISQIKQTKDMMLRPVIEYLLKGNVIHKGIAVVYSVVFYAVPVICYAKCLNRIYEIAY